MKNQKESRDITISKFSCICCKHRLFIGGSAEGSVYCRRYPPMANKDGYGISVKVDYDGICGEHAFGSTAFTKESLEIGQRLIDYSCQQGEFAPKKQKKPAATKTKKR